ncbi:MAG: ATP phosphoribosyltransferase [Gammaproteobacteria bacterium]|jgi:ATP phosphoribosyltransferase|nr:ATP phosphoribosyltransferase [Gammaproteobacteria bacterium]HJL96338.1 ATP phosphoribosyltransferase [SAR86 cluster bacterium]HJM59451.1 ATP phosphoribosyltransferase [SAR86 cluster bacterium]|tara:strand:+ start:16203 stop:16829 length:627 start_codon:yes stop_codon:yes gene_type:complete
MSINKQELVLALPKGRVFDDLLPLLEGTEFAIKDNPKNTRKLLLNTKSKYVRVLLIRGWDVPTYVTSGAANLGIVGKDILLEKESEEYIELLDLGIGQCRLSLAGKKNLLEGSTRMKIATKYPKSSIRFMESIGIQSEIIYLHGSQEIAPALNLSDAIIDLVDSGNTLKENGLYEIQVIREISTRLIANKAALKTKSSIVQEIKEVLS